MSPTARRTASLRKADSVDDITPERAAELLQERRDNPTTPRRRTAKKASAKKSPAKKAAAKKSAPKKR